MDWRRPTAAGALGVGVPASRIRTAAVKRPLLQQRNLPCLLVLLMQTTYGILCVQALQQLRARLSQGGSAPPSEETMQWFLRDRCSDCAAATQCTPNSADVEC